MSDDTSGYAPTAHLRFVRRAVDENTARFILQQWWAPDVPKYMADPRKGEWRDVSVEV